MRNSELVAFLATTDAPRSRAFYEGVLGLEVKSDDPFALVLVAGGTTIRVQKVRDIVTLPYTALGWLVDDIVAVVASLGKKGVKFERYAQLNQDENGIWKSPSGAQIAWFKDPDGNILSLTE